MYYKLGDLVEVRVGTSIAKKDLYTSGAVPYVSSPNDLSFNGYKGHSYSSLLYSPVFKSNNTLLMFRLGIAAGKTFNLALPVYASNKCLFLIIKDNAPVNSDYLALFLNSISNFIIAQSTGYVIPQLKVSTVCGIVVFLPSLSEQLLLVANTIKSMQFFTNNSVAKLQSLKENIKFSGFYSSISNRYDPFDSKTSSGSGLIYYTRNGCSIKNTRCFAYSIIDDNSCFSTPPNYIKTKAGDISKYKYTAKGIVDFKAGRKYSIPLVDPSAIFLKLLKPSANSFNLYSDDASNLFIEFDSNYSGEIEYEVTTVAQISDLAFIDPISLSTTLIENPNNYGINDISKPISTYADLISKIQRYFSTYDSSCSIGFQALESQTSQLNKLNYMVKNSVGSCRHRAFLAYLIMKSTSTPTHYVVSRTHAWIECKIANKWRYIDLGGCPIRTDADPVDVGRTETKGVVPFGQSISLEERFRIACPICPDFNPDCGYKIQLKPCGRIEQMNKYNS
jgi:hypothetical protein